MAEWFVAPAITKFNQEYEALFPGRDHASDGVLGDASHQSLVSDHNPAWNEPAPFTGIVRATDRDIDGSDYERAIQYLLARARSGADKRIWYIISNRRIWSRTFGFAQRYYNGSNPHDHHFHVSLMHDRTNFSIAPFFPTFTGADMPLTADDLNKIGALIDTRLKRALDYTLPRLLGAVFTNQPNGAYNAEAGNLVDVSSWMTGSGILGPLLAGVRRVKVAGQDPQYLVSGGMRRWIESPEMLRTWNVGMVPLEEVQPTDPVMSLPITGKAPV